MQKTFLAKIKKQQLLIQGVYGVFFLVLPFFVFYWLLPFIGSLTIGNDYGRYSIQSQLELQYSLEHGSFPLYAPGFAAGRSSAALTSGQIFHPASHLSAFMPGYWDGLALEWNTLFRLLQLGIAQLVVLLLLTRLRMAWPVAFFLSFITIYNLRMLDLFRYGASLENYTGHIFLCTAIGHYFLKPSKLSGPVFIIIATYLLICGGHPQMMFYGLLGAMIVTLIIPFAFRAINNDIEFTKHELFAFYSGVGAFSFIGVLLASAYTIPFYFDFVTDAGLRVGQNYQWSLRWSDTWGGAMESFFAPLKSDVHGAFGSSPIILFVPLVPLLFILGKRVPPVIIILWTIVIFIFLCSIGGATNIHYLFWKYFPLAQTFRTPGRITMILPFLLLLILAWFYQTATQQNGNRMNSIVPKKIAEHATFLFATFTLLLYMGFNLYLTELTPPATPVIPALILGGGYPSWLDQTLLWIGAITLLFAAIHQFGVNRFSHHASIFFGVILSIMIIFQGTIQIRHGTWIWGKTPTWTLEEMDAQKKASLSFKGRQGHGLESSEIPKQLEKSFLETRLAKFYRNALLATDQDNAYELMATDRTPRTVVLERNNGFAIEAQDPGNDQIRLIYSSFNKLTFNVEAGKAGYMVIAYPFSKQWSSYIDGEPSDIYRANGNLIATYVDKGNHAVTFQFYSTAMLIGVMVSCLTLLLIGIYFSLYTVSGNRRWITLTVSTLLSLGAFFTWHISLYNGENLSTEYQWSSIEFPPTENLSYGRPTRMSSIWSDEVPYNFYAGRAVDGDTKTAGFATNKHDNRSWWEVNLGRTRLIGEIVIHPGLDGAKNFPLQVYISENGENYKLITTITNSSNIFPVRVTIPATRAQFVRLARTQPGPMALKEVEIFTPGYPSSS